MRGKPFPKGNIPWNKNRIIKICPECNKSFEIPHSHINRRKYCSHECLAIVQSRERKGIFGIGEKNPTWKGGIQVYRRFLKKEKCEICESVKQLVVHHKDRNRYNNSLNNLIILCRSCHAKEHDTIKHITSSSVFYQQQTT
jgi:hypothetical protein